MRQQRFRPRRGFQRFSRGRQPQRRPVSTIDARQLIKKSVDSDVSSHTIKHQFADFPILEQIQANIVAKGYTIPTPIQDQAILPILEGKDVTGIANTGTGKTGAFLIPLIDKVVKNKASLRSDELKASLPFSDEKRKAEKVLIITPTRELASQIYEELYDFARGLGIHAVLCIGGANMWRQKRDLAQNPHFVIGTPGRLKDLIHQRSLILSSFHNVVLDEADRMVDIGFIDDIKYFISILPRERQSLFFSATISSKVREILQVFVRNPVTISVKQQETAENIDQDVVKVIDKHKKVDQLHDLLIQEGFDKVLIFARTKWGVQRLADELVKRGFRAGAIHGNKRQSQRQRTLEQFKRNQIQILLATDVASRGLDIENVSHVINYDMPGSYQDYIHRIGRTGRANKKGTALTFVE